MSWLIANLDRVLSLAVDHIWLSLVPIVLGFVLSVPIGAIASRYRQLRGTLVTASGILYAVPSLALFVLLPAIIGTQVLDPVNVIIALTLYAIALMVRTTADALADVEPDVIESATAMGYSTWGRMLRVDLPLAGPVLLAGMRVVAVSTVSLVSVGALIGVNSLGYLFIDGFQRDFPTEILVGIVGTVLIALAFDGLLVLLGRVLLPWAQLARPNARTVVINQQPVVTD